MKKYQFLTGFVVTAMVLLLCSCDDSGTKQPQTPPSKVTLGIGSGLVLSPILIADEKGYFLDAGLDLTVKKFSTGKASFLDMLEGATDIATSSLTPFMFTSFTRQDYAVFATFTESVHNVKIIARQDQGINTVQDLRNKKVGTPSGTSAQFFLASFLTKNGLTEEDLEIVDIKPPALPDALINHQVDAITIWEPFAYRAQKELQDKAIRLPSSEVYTETFNFVSLKAFATKHPEVIEKILRAIDRACLFIEENKSESLAIVAKRLNLDSVFAAALWDEYTFRLSLEQNLILTLEDQARWAINTGLTKETRVPNYLDYVLMDPMKKIRPSAVTIIH